jgi:molybdopterin molybdotransferase
MSKKFISYEESMQLLDTIKFDNLPTKQLYISDSLGYVLATDIKANINSPQYPTSAMDGYAIRYEDQQLDKIKIIDKNPAGSIVSSQVTKATTIKTFTGSLMPQGSDTLIPIENVTVEDNYIIINEKVPKGYSVREIGENYKKDEILIKKGTKIDFAQIGVMASMNIVQVLVYAKPIVSIASTGSEILDVGQTQENNSQIRSSNHLTLEAIAKKYGANVYQMGVVKDDKESITKLLQNALCNSDIVVTTGGVSVGDYDFVKDIIKDTLGCDVLFQGVMIKPGQHILVATKQNKIIIGLPGFAYSSTITFLLYVVPLILRLQNNDEKLQTIKAIIDTDFPKKAPKFVVTACNITQKDGQYHINFDNKKQGTSAILTNMLNNPALLTQTANSKPLKKGDLVDVILL